LVALAIIVLVQWSGGDLGGLLNTGSTQTTEERSRDQGQPPEDEGDDQAQVVPTAPASEPTATSAPTARTTDAARATRAPTPQSNAPPAARAGDLPVVHVDELPPEAHDTLRLIEQGGPFPYDRDGITFQNRERLLPQQPQGYYREYTVITPEIDHRGARRIVTGQDGEMYYTDDHYESFREIVD
jgi:ribonuclease T1